MNRSTEKQQTNADRIRQMGVEDFAVKIVDAYGIGGLCPKNHTHLYCLLENGCVQCWISWLKTPADKEADNEQ